MLSKGEYQDLLSHEKCCWVCWWRCHAVQGTRTKEILWGNYPLLVDWPPSSKIQKEVVSKRYFQGSRCSMQPIHFAILSWNSYEAPQRSSMSSVSVSVCYKWICISNSLARKQGKLVLCLHRNGVVVALMYERHSKYEINLFQCLDISIQSCEEAFFSSQNIGLEPLEVGYGMILGSAGECRGQVGWLTVQHWYHNERFGLLVVLRQKYAMHDYPERIPTPKICRHLVL